MSPLTLLEPGALESNIERRVIDDHGALASLAISVKRIADAIDGTTLGVDITESLAGITSAIVSGKHK